MKKNYKVSVIVPVYNVSKYLEECLESVKGQTLGFENIQLILVNDGSVDGSAGICTAYRDAYPDNVVYLLQENSGVAVARNNGLELAEGELVTFLDGDDKWSEDSFSTVCSAYEQNPGINVFSCKMMFFDGADGDHQLNYKYAADRIADIREDYTCPQLSSSSVFIRTEVAKQYRFTPGIKYSEDFRFINEILLDCKQMMLLSSPVYWYRRRQSNDSAIQSAPEDPCYYTPTCKAVYRYLFDLSVSKFGKVLRYLQFCVMYDLRWRLKLPLDETGMSEKEKEEYKDLIRGLLLQIDDDIILDQKRISLAILLYALEMKHGNIVRDKIVCDESGSIHYGSKSIFDLSKNHIIWIADVSVRDGMLVIKGHVNIPFYEDRFTVLYSFNDSVREVPLTHTNKNAKTYLHGVIRSDYDYHIEESVDMGSANELLFITDFDGKRYVSGPKFVTSGPLDKKNGALRCGSALVGRNGAGLSVCRYSAFRQLAQKLGKR